MVLPAMQSGNRKIVITGWPLSLNVSDILHVNDIDIYCKSIPKSDGLDIEHSVSRYQHFLSKICLVDVHVIYDVTVHVHVPVHFQVQVQVQV